ncbi:MAG TPA: HEAT repeat domain-containing protein [Bryobacteraceae bacterium]|nr:HEAT repeat domain-containing protein [Bryobacteraceae bacterium]
MIYNRLLITFCMVAAGTISPALAQRVPPAPPVAPAPPVPPVAPVPPTPPLDFDFNFDFSPGPDFDAKMADFNAKMADFGAKMADWGTQFGPQLSAKMANVGAGLFQRGWYGRSNDDRLYASGQRELDQGHWNAALTDFSEVAGRGGTRADGALYWKAYALNKLNRRDEALAAIAELRKSHAGSKWLDDASALEIEVKQASGQNVSPEGQPDEELKLMALNALVNSDPDRALPLLEGLLKGSQTPRVKERALFVLAQSNAPRAQQLLEQVARGNGNPDLQLKAIQYLGTVSRKQGNGQLLASVYAASNDENTRRAVLHALLVSGDTDRLLQAVKAEKSPELQAEGVRLLAGKPDTGDALVALYPTAQDQQVKRAILDSLYAQRNGKALVDLARKERDQETKREMVRRLSNMKTSKEANDYMLELLK